MASCNRSEEYLASQEEAAALGKKYGGLLPKKKPLISKDHERAFFDSADWALGKQGAGLDQKSKAAVETLRPKLQRTPHQQLPPRRPACTSGGDVLVEEDRFAGSLSKILIHILSTKVHNINGIMLGCTGFGTTATMSTSPSLAGGEKRHWWLSNRKVVDKYVKEARALIATQDQSEIASALNLIDAALALSPRLESALELKARSLLYLRRFKEVADMLQEYIPSVKMMFEESSLSSDNSSHQLSKERVKLLSSDQSPSDSTDKIPTFKCFSVSELKKKVMAGLCKSCEKEGQWRYLVVGQACCHLGLMEDAMVLLQTGKRLASAAFRKESVCWSDDSFSFANVAANSDLSKGNPPMTPPPTESECVSQLLGHIKLLLRRRTAALAALDAGLYSEAIRFFSKILDNRRGTPQGFLAECYMNRASAYRAAGRIAESIADCNRTLALDPTCIPALSTRASLMETIRCLPDCLRDLEHLKLLHDSILRDRKLPGPAWKRHNVRYRDVPGNLKALTLKIQELRQRLASGETGNVDYYALIGLRRGCLRSELERAHLLLSLRHRPDRAISFIDRCEFVDDRDVDSVKDQARMSALVLYRLLQKGYSTVMNTIMEEEAAERQRQKAAAALQAAVALQNQVVAVPEPKLGSEESSGKPLPAAAEIQERILIGSSNYSALDEVRERKNTNAAAAATAAAAAASVFQGVFCRDLATVGNLLSQVGFDRPIPVKYEALSC